VEAPSNTFKQSRAPGRFSGYLALSNNINEFEPSTFEEVVNEQV